MAEVTLTPADLAVFNGSIPEDRALAMIRSALSQGRLVAPCLARDDLTEDQAEAAKDILRSAVLRWADAAASGTGGLVQRQQTIGPASVSETPISPAQSKGRFWPSEIDGLLDICKAANGESSAGAFAVDTVPSSGGVHVPWCDLAFGGASCSCGVNLAGFPLWEVP